MPDVYEIQAPDGNTLEVQSDHLPTRDDALRAMRAYGDHLAAQGQAKAEAQSTVGSALRPLAKGALDTLPGLGALAGGILATPETMGAGTAIGAGLGAGVGRGARDLIGHVTGLDKPTTPIQKAGDIALDTGLAAVTPGVIDTAMHPILNGRLLSGPAKALLPKRMATAIGQLATPAKSAEPTLTRPAWQSWEPTPAPSAPTPAPTPQASSTLSASDTAGLRSQNYPPHIIARIEEALKAQGAPTPESPLRAPRIDIGAERVGRGAGLTKEQVRQQTGPVVGEPLGEASPILPQSALGRIIDDMRKLQPGAEREAYVAKATSGKARGQIENLRRTLEHLGLVVPIAAGVATHRAALFSQLSPQEQ